MQDLDGEAGFAAGELGDEVRQPGLAAIGAAPQPHDRPIALAEQGEVPLDPVDLAGDDPGRLEQLLADGGEAQALADAMEDLHRHPPLAFPDVMAEGRLGDAQDPRGAGEGAVTVDRRQHAEQLHIQAGRHGLPIYEKNS